MISFYVHSSSGINASALNSAVNAFGTQANTAGTISTSNTANAPGPPVAATKDVKVCTRTYMERNALRILTQDTYFLFKFESEFG